MEEATAGSLDARQVSGERTFPADVLEREREYAILNRAGSVVVKLTRFQTPQG